MENVVQNDNSGRIAAVTGATGEIGEAIAHQLAAKDYKVILLCRNEAKAARAVQRTIHKTGNQHISFSIVDVSRKSSIQDLASTWQGQLHVLINNAAITPRTRKETPEGIELQFATNVLGYFWMMEAFSGILKRSAPARIVNVASYWAGDLDLDDLEFKHRPYQNGTAYRQSKQANRMLTIAFAERYKSCDITVNACHPGDVNSTLSNNLGFGGHQSPAQGAATPVWVATSHLGGKVTGKYFEHKQESPCRFGKDKQGVEKLFQICKSY